MTKGASKVQRKFKPHHRARKGPRCSACGRRTKRTAKRHPMGQAKRRTVWSSEHAPCQFEGRE
jgi:hypothetical protein